MKITKMTEIDHKNNQNWTKLNKFEPNWFKLTEIDQKITKIEQTIIKIEQLIKLIRISIGNFWLNELIIFVMNLILIQLSWLEFQLVIVDLMNW